MKTHIIRKLALPTLAGLIALAGAASAAPAVKGNDHGRSWGLSHQPDFARGAAKAHAGKDGASAERDARRGVRGAKDVADGERGERRHRGHRGKRFERKDKNGDGFLTQDEVGAKRWERIKVADANGDAKISKDELRQARKDGKLGHGHKGKHGKGRKGGKGKKHSKS
jgi:hypothetical protein